VVRPTQDSIAMLAGDYWLDGDDQSLLDFYGGELNGPGADGLYQIQVSDNDCIPDCARGTQTSQAFVWDGNTYVATG